MANLLDDIASARPAQSKPRPSFPQPVRYARTFDGYNQDTEAEEQITEYGEEAGDALSTTVARPSNEFEIEATPESAHEEVGPSTESTGESVQEASLEQMTAVAAEAGEETATSDLEAVGYEASAATVPEASLPEATAGVQTGQQEFAFLAPLAAMLVSNVGPILVKAIRAKLSPRAQKAIKNAVKVAAPVRVGTGVGFGSSSLLPFIAKLLESADAGESGGEDAPEGTEGAVNEAAVAEAAATIEAIVDYDDRIRIVNTTAVPWRRYCALRIEFPSGSRFRGTGFLIGPRAVATAGHCVYMKNQGGWARSIEIIPGCDGSTHPYGSATSSEFRSTSGWVSQGLPECDYGCIFLPNGAFGNQNLGHFGLAAFDAPALLAQPAVVAGYAGDKPFAELWGASRFIKTVSAKTISYNTATMPGQSGAPVFIKRDGQRFVVGIHNYGASGGNSATRVTPPVLQRLVAWGKA